MGEVGVKPGHPVAHASDRPAIGIGGAAQVLLCAAAAVWLAMALTAPFAVSHPQDERTFATLAIALGLIACAALAPRHPGLVGLCVGLLSAAVIVALAVPDDDTRHFRQLLLAGAYIQHESGRERYAFQPVWDWPWSTFVVAGAVLASLVAAVILVGQERARRRPVRRRPRWHS